MIYTSIGYYKCDIYRCLGCNWLIPPSLLAESCALLPRICVALFHTRPGIYFLPKGAVYSRRWRSLRSVANNELSRLNISLHTAQFVYLLQSREIIVIKTSSPADCVPAADVYILPDACSCI
jgi:hypothetical protein